MTRDRVGKTEVNGLGFGVGVGMGQRGGGGKDSVGSDWRNGVK